MMDRRFIELVRLGEGHTLEFKREAGGQLGRDICAMANAIGGKILIGVDDRGDLIGVPNHNKLKSDIQNMARTMDPPLTLAIDSADDVLLITVPESANKPHSVKGRYYLREGANSQQMSRSEIREFFFREGLVYFDEVLNREFDMDRDFSEAKYQAFLKQTGIPADLDRIDLLENLKVVRNGKMTNAGALLFCRRASDYLISANVSCVMFQGDNKTKVLDQKVYNEDLFTNYQSAIAYLLSHLDAEYIIKLKREERLELPEQALREGILNAIAHRNYRSSANIQIYIFSNRVEIVNPGGLVAGLKLDDLGKRSMPRNPLLFSLMHRMYLVERIGSGFRRIRQAFNEYGLREPVVEADENWFCLSFMRPVVRSSGRTREKTREKTRVETRGKTREKTRVETRVKTRDKTREKTTETILSLIKKNSWFTAEELANLTGLSLKGIEWNIKVLKQRGILRRIGPHKGGHWEVIETGD